MPELNNKLNLKIDEFEMSFTLYMNYVNRQFKKDESYKPHPLVRALLIAFSEAENKPIGRYLGVSGNNDEENESVASSCYTVVLEKLRDDKFSILAIHDMNLGVEIPIEVGMIILALSMRLDRFQGNDIDINEAISLINDTVPQLNIILFNNQEWVSARDNFKEILEQKKFSITPEMTEISKQLSKITFEMKWEEYPPQMRTIIAQSWIFDKYPELLADGKYNMIYTVLEDRILKSQLLNNILFSLYGEPSKYFSDILEWTYFSDLCPPDNNFNKKEKVGRNDPCPCKSGKKNKNCCKIKYI
ncbi:YecA family protein [Lysinibacillus irui]|uniref:YecA family protein n=1 Tax=Lysinibacillus irui TaxID=2998077 RepID=UPI004043B556